MAKRPHRGQGRKDALEPSSEESGEAQMAAADKAPQSDVRRSRTRLCAVTRETRDESELIRFVSGPDGVLVPDLKKKLRGRGVWVTANALMVQRAAQRGHFARGLKSKVVIPANLVEQIGEQLHQSVLRGLGLAKKAGYVVLGTDRIRQAIDSEELIAVIHAIGASSDGTTKIDQKLRHFLQDSPENGIITGIFSSDELGLALGHTNVVHAALMESGVSRMVLRDIERLRRYRSGVA